MVDCSTSGLSSLAHLTLPASSMQPCSRTVTFPSLHLCRPHPPLQLARPSYTLSTHPGYHLISWNVTPQIPESLISNPTRWVQRSNGLAKQVYTGPSGHLRGPNSGPGARPGSSG